MGNIGFRTIDPTKPICSSTRLVSRALFEAFGWLVLALALVGCGTHASWTTVHVPPRYQRPRTVTLKVSESPAGDEALSLEMALVDEFAKLDVHATPLDDPKAKPTLRVVIEKWDPGSREARRFLSLLILGLGAAGDGEIVVDVEALGEDGAPTIQGKVQSLVDGTSQGALRAVAELIATMVATGSVAGGPTGTPHSGYP